jgi:hypothetical protein
MIVFLFTILLAYFSPPPQAVDPVMIPDGTYNGLVEATSPGAIRVILKDGQDAGSEVKLEPGRSNMTFVGVKVGDAIEFSLIQGRVMVYEDTTK